MAAPLMIAMAAQFLLRMTDRGHGVFLNPLHEPLPEDYRIEYGWSYQTTDSGDGTLYDFLANDHRQWSERYAYCAEVEEEGASRVFVLYTQSNAQQLRRHWWRPHYNGSPNHTHTHNTPPTLVGVWAP